MEKTALEMAKNGSIIARDVYTIEGKLLVKKGTIFREPLTQRFWEYGIDELYIEKDDNVKDESVAMKDATLISHGKMPESMDIPDIIQHKTRIHAHQQMKKTLANMSAVSNSNIYQLKKIVEEMIEELLVHQDFVQTLSQLRSIDDYTYQHSVNVGVLSLMIGIDLNLSRHTLMELGLGAMLHDVGKIIIPDEIIKKPSKLTPTEYASVKKHTEYGYEILRRINVSEEAAQIALYHHEKYNGLGYNCGLKGKEIPLLARIATVADVYDAMSHDRVYQKKASHDKVYREITHLGNIHFDTEIMEIFAKRLNIYPTGMGIILNSGQRGMVIGQNSLYPESPCVRIFTPEKRSIQSLYFDLDLSVQKESYIVSTF